MIRPRRYRSPRIERFLPETLNELQVECNFRKRDCDAPLVCATEPFWSLLYASGLRISVGAKLKNPNLAEVWCG